MCKDNISEENKIGSLFDFSDNSENSKKEEDAFQVHTISRKNYPDHFRLLKDVPDELFIKGTLPKGFYIAIVGTRRPSPNAFILCDALAKSLARSSAVIVSGLAQGIDSYIHEAALRYHIPTVAVLAQGLGLKIAGSRGILAEKILESNGALISEYPGQTPSFKTMFPARNRIIAGLSLVTVVVESKKKGGSLITADFAVKFKRKLLCVPGNFNSEYAEGPIDLLRKGLAKPIYLPEDLCALCGILKQKTETLKRESGISEILSDNAKTFYKKFAGYSKNISELHTESGHSTSVLFAILTELELAGLVTSQDNFLFYFEKESF